MARIAPSGWLRYDWRITMLLPPLDPIRNEPEFAAIFDEVQEDVARMRARMTAADRRPPL